MARYIIALTGASGIKYGLRLTGELLKREHEVHLVVSEPAVLVLRQEMNWPRSGHWEDLIRSYLPHGNLFYYDNTDIAAPIASGSFIIDGMVIAPCTMSTVAAVAHGMSSNLIGRAADVILKEQKQLILVPRETPLSVVHLRNMLLLAEMGVVIVPAMPAFYHQPESIDDMIDFMVGKVLDIMGIPHDLFARYKGTTAE
ncbi:MAG: flavin prenyltransferase UbiX [Syntrophomonadaceae bacterium]|nr:flavin prenyltransferase UbiX [Syntrophomonadaceae bacterium]